MAPKSKILIDWVDVRKKEEDDDDDETVAFYDETPEYPGKGSRCSGQGSGVFSDEEDDEATVPILDSDLPVEGWLVCVSGSLRGKDFSLREEVSSAGSAPGCDIQLAGQRAREFLIIFDPKHLEFYVSPENGAEISLDGKRIRSPQKITAGSIISAGYLRFEFVPFCRGGHAWEDFS